MNHPSDTQLKGNGAPLDDYLKSYLRNNSSHHYGSTSSVPIESSDLNNLHTSSLIINTQHEWKGLLFMLLSAFGFSLNGLVVKLSGYYFSAATIVLARSIFQFLAGVLLAYCWNVPILGHSRIRFLLGLRGLFGAVGLAFYYYSLTVLPIADATVIFFTCPVFTSLLAFLSLNEAYTWFDGLCSISCLIGVILTARPTFLFGENVLNLLSIEPTPLEQSIGVLAALLGACFSACAYVTVRKIGRAVHFLNHVISFGFASTLFSGMMLLFDNQSSKLPNYQFGLNLPTTLLILVGFTAVLGQCLLNKGLQLCRAGPATLMRNVDVVFAYIYGIFIFNEIPNLFSISGATIIILGTVAMGLKKWYA